jgi:hypothetical protein
MEYVYHMVPCPKLWTEAREDAAAVSLAVLSVKDAPEYTGRAVRRALKSYAQARNAAYWFASDRRRKGPGPRASLAR